MKVLVIPDIHLKSWIFDIARYRDTFDRAIRFATGRGKEKILREAMTTTPWIYGVIKEVCKK